MSGSICALTTPLYVREGVVPWFLFLLENGVMWGILLLSLVCLTVFIVLYKTAIEVDDVAVAVEVEYRGFCDLVLVVFSFETSVAFMFIHNKYITRIVQEALTVLKLATEFDY